MHHKINCLILILIFFTTAFSQSNLPEVQIGFILDGKWYGNEELLKSIKAEIIELTKGEFDVQFPASKTILGDWSAEKVGQALNQLLADPEVDIIITPGVISSHIAGHRKNLPKPVLVPYVLDAKLQNFPIKDGKSGVPNLCYISLPQMIVQDLSIFSEIVEFQKLAVLIDKFFYENIDEFSVRLQTMLTPLNINAVVIPVNESVESAVNSLTPEFEAVYVMTVVRASDSEFQKLVDALKDKKLPSFASSGAERVEQGILAGLHKDMISRVSRRVALNIQRILLGDKPESIPVSISLDKQLTINETTARAVNISPPWAVMTEAQLVGKEQHAAEIQWRLDTAVQTALNANLDLAAKGLYVSAGKQNVNDARSNLLPGLEASATYVVLDKDRATSSLGQMAERTLTGNLTLTQLIYSEPAWANLSIQKELQRIKQFEFEQVKLDVVMDAATAYLNVLRAQSYERIQLANLKVSRKNLELARVRELIGSAGPAEVFRWESEIASNRKSVIEANSQRNVAEIQLNRLLHRPAEESFVLAEIGLSDPALVTSHPEINRYIENKQAFKIFRQFMVNEAMDRSPEIKLLDAAIAAKKRQLRSTSHQFWSPTIALQAQVENILSREGAGVESNFQLPEDLDFEFELPTIKSLSWNVAVSASLPIFTGGAKFAARQKSLLELEQYETERNAAAEKIEQRIRSALHFAGASYASIQQARLAAEAARKSLKVVQDSYSQGLVSIVELLDAQQAALITDQAAANSVYDFVIDLMNVERAYGDYTMLSDPQRIDRFFGRAAAFNEKEMERK